MKYSFSGDGKCKARLQAFFNDESAMKSILLIIKNASKNWKKIHHWKPALQVFQIQFGEDRMPVSSML